MELLLLILVLVTCLAFYPPTLCFVTSVPWYCYYFSKKNILHNILNFLEDLSFSDLSWTNDYISKYGYDSEDLNLLFSETLLAFENFLPILSLMFAIFSTVIICFFVGYLFYRLISHVYNGFFNIARDYIDHNPLFLLIIHSLMLIFTSISLFVLQVYPFFVDFLLGEDFINYMRGSWYYYVWWWYY